jgi:hypothetical protein
MQRFARAGGRLLSLLTLGGSCTSHVSTESLSRDVTQWVTGEAMQRLDSKGQFLLSPVDLQTSQPTISEQRAVELAVAFLNSEKTNPGLIALLRAQRGGQEVNFDRLTASPRTEVSLSAYETTPPAYGGSAMRSFGSLYFVRFLDQDVPILTVSVSAHATDVSVVNGRIQFPPVSGGEFLITGDPIGRGYDVPLSPELAARMVAEATGARIDRVPLLRRPEWLFSGLLSRWLLHLDRPVRFRRLISGEIVQTDSVYLGLALDSKAVGSVTLLLPQEFQPTTQEIATNIQLQVRPGFPVWFDRAIVAR